jgi:ferrous iron transport protein B
MWDRALEYLKKIAGVILIASIIFWSLSYFPQNSQRVIDVQTQKLVQIAKIDIQLQQNSGVKRDSLLIEKTNSLNYFHQLEKSYQREDSYLGQFGKFIEPTLRPIGMDWKLGISLMSGLTAKEIIVSTLAVLYQVDEDSKYGNTLVEKLKAQRVVDGPRQGKPVFTPLIAFVFMIFVSIYFPCIGSIVAISKESGSAKWGFLTVAYTMTLAWVISFLVFQIGTLFGL